MHNYFEILICTIPKAYFSGFFVFLVAGQHQSTTDLKQIFGMRISCTKNEINIPKHDCRQSIWQRVPLELLELELPKGMQRAIRSNWYNMWAECIAIWICFDNCSSRAAIFHCYSIICSCFVTWITVTCFPPSSSFIGLNDWAIWNGWQTKKTHIRIYRFYLMAFRRRMDNAIQNNGSTTFK